MELRHFWLPVELPRSPSALLLRINTTSSVFFPAMAGQPAPLGLHISMNNFLDKSIDIALLYRTLERHLHKPD